MNRPEQLPPPRGGRVRGPRLHLLLAAVTFLSLGVAGGFFWNPTELPGVESELDLLRPSVLWTLFGSGLQYAVWVFVILGCHEMGHYLACRYYGIPATLPFFLPGPPPLGSFGAVIRIRGPIPHRRALFDIAAAGPIAGFVVALPVLFAGLITAEPFESPAGEESAGAFHLGEPVALMLLARMMDVDRDMAVNSLIGAGWVGLLVTSLNLFPVGQLDGGHAAYAISRRLHRVLTRVTLLALLGVIGIQTVVFEQFPSYAVWFAILLWMRDRHPRLIDETSGLGPGRRLIAILLAAIFALSFILVPIYVT